MRSITSFPIIMKNTYAYYQCGCPVALASSRNGILRWGPIGRRQSWRVISRCCARAKSGSSGRNRVHAMMSDTNPAILRIRDRDSLLREACRISYYSRPIRRGVGRDARRRRNYADKVAATGRHPQLFGDGPFPLDHGRKRT